MYNKSVTSAVDKSQGQGNLLQRLCCPVERSKLVQVVDHEQTLSLCALAGFLPPLGYPHTFTEFSAEMRFVPSVSSRTIGVFNVLVDRDWIF